MPPRLTLPITSQKVGCSACRVGFKVSTYTRSYALRFKIQRHESATNVTSGRDHTTSKICANKLTAVIPTTTKALSTVAASIKMLPVLNRIIANLLPVCCSTASHTHGDTALCPPTYNSKANTQAITCAMKIKDIKPALMYQK